MSLDGYVAGPNQSVTNPLGEDGEKLHEWVIATRSWRKMHGKDGGTNGPDDAIFDETLKNIGATIMGRHMFGGGTGPWGNNPWRGWWGENPPFHTPVFVLTHHARDPLEMQGGTTFHFVTGGIRDALERARKAAQGKDISLAGGADIAQQYLKARLVDEMELHVVPLMLGSGARLFEKTDAAQTAFECVRVVNSPSASHYSYRRRR